MDDASSDPDVISRWWRDHPASNVAIACGAGSGLDVFDVDGEIGRATLAQLEAENSPLPWTVVARTGKGKHYFFKHDPRVWNRVSLGPGLDIRTDGGYVVAAPSEHLSGKVYEWEISPEESDAAPWPEWLILKLLALREQKKSGVAPNLPPASLVPTLDRVATTYTVKAINTCLSEMEASYAPTGGEPGNRNETLNRNAYVLGQLVGAGEPVGNALELLCQIALAKGMDESEVREVSGRAFMAGQTNPKEIRILVERAEREAHRTAQRNETPVNETPPITPPAAPAPVQPKKPVICSDHRIAAMTDASEAALLRADAAIYHRYGELVRVRQGETRLLVDALPEPSLFEAMSVAANWEKWDKTAQAYVPCKPPADVVKVLAARGTWRFNQLLQVFDAPTLRPDGTVLQDLGYDLATKAIYAPSVSFPRVPDAPTRDDALAALALLNEPVAEFPWKEPSDYSTWIALLLTVMGRPSVKGPTPMFVVRATDRSVGKTKLVDVVNVIRTGAFAARMTFQDNTEEESKSMLSLGRTSTPLALIDNVNVPLGGEVLAAALTATTYMGRVLGETRMLEVPVPVLAATGVNVMVKDDLGRRVLPIDLDPGCENPGSRVFKIGDLEAWSLAHRVELAAAALTVLRAFHTAGCPQANLRPFASYESWSARIRQVCVWLGLEDPVLGNEKIVNSGDMDRDAVLTFFQVWHQRFSSWGSTTHEALGIARHNDAELLEAMLLLDPKCQPDRLDSRRVTNCLSRLVGRVVGGLRLEKGDRTKRGVLWKVQNLALGRSAHVATPITTPNTPPITRPGDEGDEGDEPKHPKHLSSPGPITMISSTSERSYIVPGDEGDDFSNPPPIGGTPPQNIVSTDTTGDTTVTVHAKYYRGEGGSPSLSSPETSQRDTQQTLDPVIGPKTGVETPRHLVTRPSTATPDEGGGPVTGEPAGFVEDPDMA